MLSCKSYSYIPLPQTLCQICCLGMLHGKREGERRQPHLDRLLWIFFANRILELINHGLTRCRRNQQYHYITCTPSPPNHFTIFKMGSWSTTCSSAEAFGSGSYRHSKPSYHASDLPQPLQAAAPHTTPALAAHCTTSGTASWTFHIWWVEK